MVAGKIIKGSSPSTNGKLLLEAISKNEVMPGIVITLILSFKIFKR